MEGPRQRRTLVAHAGERGSAREHWGATRASSGSSMSCTVSSKSGSSKESLVTAAGSNQGGELRAHDGDDVIDVPGAMALLKLGRSAVYDACGRGEIPHRRIGKHIRFSRAALLRWLEGAR